MEGGRVTGATTPSGELRAPLVVGADGTRSAVARMVGVREYHPTPSGRVFMWSYYEADPTDGEMWIGKIGDHTYLGMPTDGGLTLVGICPSIERRDEVSADRDAVYDAGLRAWPQLHAGVDGARRDGSVRTMANMRGFFRPAAGPGWALVGDAGHFKDPTPGQGIADALRQSEKLAAAITRALDGSHRSPDEILRDWWRWRDEDAWEMYWLAHDMGAAGPTSPLAMRASGGSPRTPSWPPRWFESSTTSCAPRSSSRRPSPWPRWRGRCVAAAVTAGGSSCVRRERSRSRSYGGDGRRAEQCQPLSLPPAPAPRPAPQEPEPAEPVRDLCRLVHVKRVLACISYY